MRVATTKVMLSGNTLLLDSVHESVYYWAELLTGISSASMDGSIQAMA